MVQGKIKIVHVTIFHTKVMSCCHHLIAVTEMENIVCHHIWTSIFYTFHISVCSKQGLGCCVLLTCCRCSYTDIKLY